MVSSQNNRTMRVTKKQATGVLGTLLAQIDERQQARTRTKMIVAARIEDALAASNMTQKEFARLMGRSESEICSWLSGERNFTLDTLTDISIVLRTNLLPFALDESLAESDNILPTSAPPSRRSTRKAVAAD